MSYLQVAVDDVEIVDKSQSRKNLHCNSLESRKSEVQFIARISVILVEFEQIVSEQLAHEEQMFLVIEKIKQLQNMVFVWVTFGVDVSQHLDFVERLVKKLLGILCKKR